MIITPESSLKNLVESLDKVLVLLDEASEHFIGTVLNKEDLTEDIKKLENKEKWNICLKKATMSSWPNFNTWLT